MARLKAETADLHRDAETSRFQRALVQGALPAAAYAAWLGQMLLIHEALEAALDASTDPLVAALNRPEYDRAGDLRADVADTAAGAAHQAATPLAATRELVGRIHGASALDLLGMRYVLEGSNNGNRYIARAVRKALPEAPTRYLDPYGEDQPARWAEFKRDWDAADLGPEAQNRLVSAARGMFESIRDLSGQLADATMAEPGA
jgi:heme oxygenase